MAIKVWNNPAGGNWSTGANWVGGVAPVLGDNVQLPTLAGVGVITITMDVLAQPAIVSTTGTRSYQLASGAGGLSTDSFLILGAGQLGTTLSVTAVISGLQGLSITGPGKVSLFAANTFAGDISLFSGNPHLILLDALSFGGGSAIAVNTADPTLEFSFVGNVNLPGWTLNANSTANLTVEMSNAGDMTFGAVANAAVTSLIYSRTAAGEFTNANSFGGGTEVPSGSTVSYSGPGSTGTNPIVIDTGGIVNIAGEATIPNALTVDGTLNLVAP